MTTTVCQYGPGAWPVSALKWTYPGRIDEVREVRQVVRRLLSHCPVADDVVTLVWELAANACQHSDSRLPGGHVTVSVSDVRGRYVYASVRDQGSAWSGDLKASARRPRGLYLLREMSTTCGTAGTRRNRVTWFLIRYSGQDGVS